MTTTTTVDVRLWGISVGKLKWDDEKDLAVFQFSQEYIDSKYDLCPVKHRRSTEGSVRAILFMAIREINTRDCRNSLQILYLAAGEIPFLTNG